MTAPTFTCDSCAIRWVESDGATCPGCSRRGERAGPERADLSAAVERLLVDLQRFDRAPGPGLPTSVRVAIEDVRGLLGGGR